MKKKSTSQLVFFNSARFNWFVRVPGRRLFWRCLILARSRTRLPSQTQLRRKLKNPERNKWAK
jgi:hypothetical protein